MGISVGGSFAGVSVRSGNLLKSSGGAPRPTYKEARLERLERPMRKAAKRRDYDLRVARAKAYNRKRKQARRAPLMAILKWSLIGMMALAFWPFVAAYFLVKRTRG